MYFEFPGEKLFPRRSHFRSEAFSGEKPFKKNLLLLPCKECSKSFSESGSLRTLIQKKSHLLVKNVPNHFLKRSHSPLPCSLFHKRKSIVPFQDSKNSNLILTFSLLCPLLSSNMSLSMFWLLRRSLTTILQRIFEIRKESCWVVSLIFK